MEGGGERCKEGVEMAADDGPGVSFRRGFAIDPLNFSLLPPCPLFLLSFPFFVYFLLLRFPVVRHPPPLLSSRPFTLVFFALLPATPRPLFADLSSFQLLAVNETDSLPGFCPVLPA